MPRVKNWYQKIFMAYKRDELSKLRNLGPKSSAWLRAVGIKDLEDLKRIGPAEVYLRLQREGFKVSMNLVWALQGAI